MSPPPPPDLSSYRLSRDQLTAIFETSILPNELPPSLPSSPSSPPLAVLAVGQTGAGKTRLAPAILSALRAASRSPAHFIADTYKTYHPAFADLVRRVPHLASPATSDDARLWLAMVAEEATRRRVDVLLESACRHPDDFASLAAIFRESGYRVEVAVLAVPAALSRLGILTRFYENLPEGQSGNLPIRLTPTKIHDDSFRGLLSAAAFLDASGTADQVVVVRRGNLVAYGEERDGHGKMRGGVADAILKERERPLTDEEVRIAMDDIRRLSAIEGPAAQLELVKALLQPLTGERAKSRRAPFPELHPLEFGHANVGKESRGHVFGV